LLQSFINVIGLLYSDMSNSIMRRNLPYDFRQRRHELGEQGEINVGKILCEYFGFRKVSYGYDDYSSGTDGYPDIVLKLNPILAIEVKSIKPFTMKKNKNGIYKSAGYVAIRRDQWYEELKFARERLGKLILIVEVRLRDKGLYFWFNSDQIEEYMKKLKGERIHIHLDDILNKARSLIYPDEIKYLEYWNQQTPVDNDYQLNIV